MTIGTQFYHGWVFRGLPGSLHSHCNPPGGFSFVSLHFPFYRMCTHPSPNTFPSPPLELPFIRPWLFLFPSHSLSYSETLLSHFARQCLSSFAPNFQRNWWQTLFIPSLLGTQPSSLWVHPPFFPVPPKAQEKWELLASSRRLSRWAFLPVLEIFENGPL